MSNAQEIKPKCRSTSSHVISEISCIKKSKLFYSQCVLIWIHCWNTACNKMLFSQVIWGYSNLVLPIQWVLSLTVQSIVQIMSIRTILIPLISILIFGDLWPIDWSRVPCNIKNIFFSIQDYLHTAQFKLLTICFLAWLPQNHEWNILQIHAA